MRYTLTTLTDFKLHHWCERFIIGTLISHGIGNWLGFGSPNSSAICNLREAYFGSQPQGAKPNQEVVRTLDQVAWAMVEGGLIILKTEVDPHYKTTDRYITIGRKHFIKYMQRRNDRLFRGN